MTTINIARMVQALPALALYLVFAPVMNAVSLPREERGWKYVGASLNSSALHFFLRDR